MQPHRSSVTATLVAAIALAGPVQGLDDPGFAPCPRAQKGTTDPPTARVVVTVLSVEPNSDMEGGDGAIPFYDNRADVYGKVIIDGVEFDLPKIDENDFPHWDEQTTPGAHTGRFVQEVTAVPDESGMTPLPVTIRIEIYESDGALTGDDDVVDIDPSGDDRALDLELDLCSLHVSGDVASNGNQGVLESSGGSAGDAATIRFKVELEDGRPVSAGDVALVDLDLVQVIPRTHRLAADKPTVLLVRVANNYDTPVTTELEVRITGGDPSPFVDVVAVEGLEPGEVRKLYLYRDEPLLFPDLGQPYDVSVNVEIDPDGILPDSARTEPGDCRRANNGGDQRWSWKVVPTEAPWLLWAKVGLDLDIGHFASDERFDTIHDLGMPFIRATYPNAHFFDTVSPVPLPVLITPGIDWLRAIIPGNDALDPFLMVAELNEIAFVLGYDRILGVLPNKDWFDRFEGWSSRSGVSMGEVLPKAVAFLPRKVRDEGVGPAMTLPAHELGHTYGLSVDPALKDDWRCEVDVPVLGTILCASAGGFDEYENDVSPYDKGNPARGFWVHPVDVPAELAGIAGSEQCDSHCFMGSTKVNAWDHWGTRRRWIDPTDFDHLLDQLELDESEGASGTLGAGADGLVFVSGMIALAADFEADGAHHAPQRDDALILHVRHVSAADVGRRRADRSWGQRAQVGLLRFRDGDGTLLAEAGIPLRWPRVESEDGQPLAELPVSFFGLTLPFPAATRAVEVLRHTEYDGPALLASRPVSGHAPVVRLLPTSVGRVDRGAPLELAWEGEDADGDQLAYGVQLRPAAGSTWWPAARDLPGRSCEVDTEPIPPGDYLARVFACDGVHVSWSDSVRFTVAAPGPMGGAWWWWLLPVAALAVWIVARRASRRPAAGRPGGS